MWNPGKGLISGRRTGIPPRNNHPQSFISVYATEHIWVRMRSRVCACVCVCVCAREREMGERETYVCDLFGFVSRGDYQEEKWGDPVSTRSGGLRCTPELHLQIRRQVQQVSIEPQTLSITHTNKVSLL